jgi:uncharacterized membrane protein
MKSELDLLRSLDDEPRKPSTVDIQRAIVAGRRRRVRRGVGYAGAATVTALAVAGASVAGGVFDQAAPQVGASGAPPVTAPAAPAPPTSCTLERLAVPDNAPMALVSGADPSGRYLVGRSYPKAGGYQAVIWHDGTARKVMLPGDAEESLPDVNSSGTAVGWSYEGSDGNVGPVVPYVYRDGTVSKLPGARRGSAYAINDAGAIVGDDDAGHALLWSSATAQPVRLPVPAGTKEAVAIDIDEDGTVAGTIDNARPYVWFPDGTHRQLAMPELDGKPAVTARVFGIRNGWATGVATNGEGRKGDPEAMARGKVRGVRWNIRTGEVSLVAGLQGGADAVNAHGWQVGTDQQGRAVLVADGATVALPALPDQKPGTLTNIPNTLSDDGRTIAGQSDDATGTIQPVVWHCQ